MNRILVTGGRERENWFELGDGKAYDAAKVHQVDMVSGSTSEVLCVDKVSENYPRIHPNIQFTAGCIDSRGVWLPTDTELRL